MQAIATKESEIPQNTLCLLLSILNVNDDDGLYQFSRQKTPHEVSEQNVGPGRKARGEKGNNDRYL